MHDPGVRQWLISTKELSIYNCIEARIRAGLTAGRVMTVCHNNGEEIATSCIPSPFGGNLRPFARPATDRAPNVQ